MTIRMQRILELYSILNLLYLLYGRKPRNIMFSIVFLFMNVIILYVLEYCDFDLETALLPCAAVIVYCIWEFGLDFRSLITNILLCVVILNSLQATAVFLISVFLKNRLDGGNRLLMAELQVLVIVLLILPECRINRISCYLQRGRKEVKPILGLVLIAALFLRYRVRKMPGDPTDWCLILGIFLLIICYLIYQWQKSRYEADMAVRLFHAYQTGNEVYRESMEQIKAKQHNYKNLINSIYCQHYTCRTYEELVKVQKQYCDILCENIREQDIPDTGNPVITSFVLLKVTEMKKAGIQLICKGNLILDEQPAAIMDQIEILGNLLDNAIEELQSGDSDKKIFIRSLADGGTKRGYEIRNIVNRENAVNLTEIMRRGYSTKGRWRGFGLYNCLKICEEENWALGVFVDHIENRDWICFQVTCGE